MTDTKINDVKLVQDYIQGKEQSLGILINRHQRRIFSHIYKLVRDYDIANDIFQDAFIKVIHTLKSGKYNEEGKFLPWVMRIAHNLSIDHLRREKKKNIISNQGSFDIFDFIPSETKNIEEHILEGVIKEEVKELLNYLPKDQREVVQMRHFAGLSFKEISEETGVSINTALGRMRYALINLRKIIEEKNICLTTL